MDGEKATLSETMESSEKMNLEEMINNAPKSKDTLDTMLGESDERRNRERG